MSPPVCALVLVAAMLSACKKPEGKPAATNDSVMSGTPAMAPLDYLAAQAKAKKFAERSITTSELTSAIQKFNAMEDRYPRDLGELVQQHYLQAPPVAPRAMAFASNPQTGEIRIVRIEPPAPAP